MLHALALEQMQGRWWKDVGLQEGKGNGFKLREGQKPSTLVKALPRPGQLSIIVCIRVCVKEISFTRIK